MIKKLTKHGNSLALVIEKPVLEMLNISQDTPLKVSTDGKQIFIAPATPEESDQKFRGALANVNSKYSKALKKLAE